MICFHKILKCSHLICITKTQDQASLSLLFLSFFAVPHFSIHLHVSLSNPLWDIVSTH